MEPIVSPDLHNRPRPLAPSSSVTKPTTESVVLSTVAPTISEAPREPKGAPLKPKKLPALIAVALVVLIVGVGSAASYIGYYRPRQPENVMLSALNNFIAAKSGHFEGSLASKDKQGKDTGSATFVGDTAGDGKLMVSAAVDVTVTKVTIEARSLDGKTYYVKVGGLDGLPQLLSASGSPEAAQYAPLLTGINNQWYEINQSLINNYLGGQLALGDWSADDYAKLTAAYKNHPFMVVKQTYANQKIKGTDCLHYKIGVDKTALKAFIKDIQSAKLKALTLDAAIYSNLIKDLDAADVSKYGVDVWISKDKHEFRQFGYTQSDDSGATTFTLTLSDYNKSFSVQKPADAQSILQILSQFLGGVDPSSSQAVPQMIQNLESNDQSGEGIPL